VKTSKCILKIWKKKRRDYCIFCKLQSTNKWHILKNRLTWVFFCSDWFLKYTVESP
jgi:hypothetical protein